MPLGSNTPPPAIPGFEFVSVLGAGGFSDVYLYQQKLPRRQVAIKVLHIDGLDRTLRRQFVAEANLMAQLSSHPAIATIYAAEVTENAQPYLVMEYCSGGSLGTAYKAAPLPLAEVLRVGIRVSSALEAAHRLGIVHRDIKPANILVTDYGMPVLTDFGISIGDDGIGDSTMFSSHEATSEASGSSHGLSIPWAPPEAFADEPVGTPQSDVFSLAATLFTLLEGRSPFEIRGAKNGPVQLSRRIETGAVNPATRADVPESLRTVLATGMATEPADRFPTALAFADALQAVQTELGLPVTQIELPVTITSPIDVVAAVDLAQTVLPEESIADLETIVVDRPAPAAVQPSPAAVVPPARVEPESVPPAVVPAAVQPAAVQPAAVQPAAVQPAAVQPAALQPAAVQAPALQPAVIQPPTPPWVAGAPTTYTALVPPGPRQPRKRGRIILISAIAAVLVLGILGGTIAALIPRDDPSPAQADDEEVVDDTAPTTVPLCDVDYLTETAELWEVSTSDLARYSEGTDEFSLESGLDTVCGLSVPASPYYADNPVQEIYFGTDASDADISAILGAYGDCEEPTDWSTFTSWTCSTSKLFVSIRLYTEDKSYLRPEAVGNNPYFQVISYVYK